jgi:transposase-like protein
MNLTQIASADLKRVVTLVEQKETLLAQVAQLNAELASFQAGESVAPAAPVKAKPGRKPGRPAKAKAGARGALKAAIVALLQGAGAAGLTVQAIAATLKAKPGNVHVWFSSTGKTIKEIRKLAPGTYGWTGTAAPAPAPAAKVEEPKAPKRAARKVRARKTVAVKAEKPVGPQARAQKPQAKKYGAAKEAIIGLLKASGKTGITVKEVAGKLGVKPQGVYVWFGNTGKKVKEIKKVAPATYAWVG